MAMPRPGGKAFKIAEKVVPGLTRAKRSRTYKKKPSAEEYFSKVEIMQTNNIENKEGLV